MIKPWKLAGVLVGVGLLGWSDIGYSAPAVDARSLLWRGEEQAALPDVVAEAVRPLERGVEIDFRVVRPASDNTTRFVITVPQGIETSVSLLKTWSTRVIGGLKVGNEEILETRPLVSSVRAEELGYVRRHRLVRIAIPEGVLGIENQRVVRGTLRADWLGTPKLEPVPAEETRGLLRTALEKLVLNSGDLDRLAGPFAGMNDDAGVMPTWTPARYPWAVRVPTETAGWYRISGRDLESSGVVIRDVLKENVRLVRDGVSVPLLLVPARAGDATGPLGSDDALVFRADDSASTYSAKNVAWLVSDPQLPAATYPSELPPADVAQIDVNAAAFREHVVAEEDRVLQTQNDQFLSILDYRWVWTRLLPNKPFTVDMKCPNLAELEGGSRGSAALVKFYVHDLPARSEPIPIRISVGGHPGDLYVVSGQRDEKTVPIPAGVLTAAGTSMTITVETTAPLTHDLYLDSVTYSYSRTYDAAGGSLDFLSPEGGAAGAARVVAYNIGRWTSAGPAVVADVTSGAVVLVRPVAPAEGGALSMLRREAGPRQYEARGVNELPAPTIELYKPSVDLRAQGPQVDTLIIGYRDFLPAIGPYMQQLEAEGHSVAAVSIQEVYNQFSAGQETPVAIRSFLRHAATHWTGSKVGPAVGTVILVGDCTSAYRNQFHNSVVNYVPTYPYVAPYNAGERYASDAWFGQVSGADLLADVVVGRFSFNNTRDIERSIAKTLEDRKAPDGAWKNTLGFVADHSEFEESTSRVMHDGVPPGYFVNRIFMGEEPWIDNFYFPKEIADAKKAKVSNSGTAKVRRMFESGARLVTYFGHGSPNIWGTERLWFGGDSENSDILSLHHSGRYPVVINMTCNSGAIDYPMPKWNVCISEDFMRQPDGGAVACWVPSGPGTTPQHERLAQEFLRATLREHVEPLGAATALATWRYLAKGGGEDLARMFILLGDPYILMRFPPEDKGAPPPDALKQWVAMDAAGRYAASPITTTATAASLQVDEGNAPAEEARGAAYIGGKRYAEQTSASLPGVLAVTPRRVVTTGTDVQVNAVLGNTLRLGAALPSGLVGGDAVQLAPGEALARRVTVPVKRGLQRVTVPPTSAVALPGAQQAEVTVVGLDPTAKKLLLEPDQRTARYVTGVSGPVAMVHVHITNLGLREIPPCDVFYTDINGRETSTPLSALLPGETSGVELTYALPVTFPEEVASRVRAVALDGTTLLGETTVKVGRRWMGDLHLESPKIVSHPSDPTDGETIFFDVVVENRGQAMVRGIRLTGVDQTVSSAPQTMESRVLRTDPAPDLAPGQQRSMRLRWDPFRNAGERHIRLTAACSDASMDADMSDNSANVDVQVRRKYQLKRGPITVVPPNAQDRAEKRLRFLARVVNDGESAAHFVRVVFYSTPDKKPANLLGEVLVETVPPKGYADALLTYPLKPGEEKFPFTPAFDAFLKGSAQRQIQER